MLKMLILVDLVLIEKYAQYVPMSNLRAKSGISTFFDER